MNAPEENKKVAQSKKATKGEELKTEGPISEKDEVKAAEQRTAKLHKKASKYSKSN